MFNNFIKKIKLNLLTIKNKFLFFIKLINFNLFFNFFYFYIICSCFISIESYNTFFFQFLYNIIFFINPVLNIFIFLFFYFFISLTPVFLNVFKNLTNFKSSKIFSLNSNNVVYSTSNSVYLQFLYYLYNKSSFIININYLYYWYLSFINYYYFNNFLIRFFVNFIYTSKPIYWYTVFKRHSIFGFYRSNRQT
jgi:hypothetical protein